jgi:acyl carrier protein
MSADPLATPPVGETVPDTLRAILHDVLGLDRAAVARFDAATPLFGALPELDSMAVAGLLTEIEDRFTVIIDDDDVDGDTFETFGSLTAFVEAKLSEKD